MSITRTRNPVCKVSWRPAENGNSLQFLTRMSKAVDIKLSNFQSLNWGGGSKIHLYLKWNVWQIVLNGLTGHVHCVWKLLKMSHLHLVILFDCKLRVFKKSPKLIIFGIFHELVVHSKCKRSSLRSHYWMRLFLWFSNTVHVQDILSQFVNVGVVATQFFMILGKCQLFNEMLKNALGAVFSTYLS